MGELIVLSNCLWWPSIQGYGYPKESIVERGRRVERVNRKVE